jgi:putative Mg2+ transporter-C (MgtC) family protein
MLDNWELLSAIVPGYAVKVLVAVGCGLLLGIERERKEKPAGLRTIVLITVGATLYMIISDLITLTTSGPDAITRVDPSRIASQVVTGIGFLGAGTIIQARGSVQGLTTAATIWVAAGIGLCIGVGFPILATATTLLVLLVLVVLGPVRTHFSRRGTPETLQVLIPDDSLIQRHVRLVLDNFEIPESEITTEPIDDEHVVIRASYQMGPSSALRMVETLHRIEGVQGFSTADGRER